MLLLAATLLGGRGDDGMNPKLIKKIVIKRRVTITWKGFFTQSHILLSPIVVTVLWLSKHTTRTDPAICFYLHLALWMMFFTMETPQNSPYAHVGHVFSQILSGYLFSTLFVRARNNFPRTRGQVVLIK